MSDKAEELAREIDLNYCDWILTEEPTNTAEQRTAIIAALLRQHLGESRGPAKPMRESLCTCSNTPNETKCQKHGQQPGNRELCPECGKVYLGYCMEGEYCTSDDCNYAY